ncbi:gliding motility lipoprotein GldB [Coprobacter sp.]
MIKRQTFKIIIICISIFIWGCRKDKPISSSETDLIVLERFDRDLPEFISGKIKDSTKFIKQYSDFLPIYCYGILNLSLEKNEDSLYNRSGVSEFLSNATIKKLYNDTEKEFYTDDDIVSELSDAFSRYHYLFPENAIPRILTHISGLNQSIISTDSLISISLDQYLGASYPYYKNVFYPYQLPMKERNRIASDVIHVLLYTQYPPEDDRKTLLDKMVYEGAILYTLQQIFPKKTIGQLLGYQDKEINWSKKNEPAIWDKIIRQKHLFSTDLLLKSKYTGPAPFTSPISPESPGRIGCWIGWRIVSEYMKRSDSSLQELLKNSSNGELILKISKYKG